MQLVFHDFSMNQIIFDRLSFAFYCNPTVLLYEDSLVIKSNWSQSCLHIDVVEFGYESHNAILAILHVKCHISRCSMRLV